jgi:hypothetical protein
MFDESFKFEPITIKSRPLIIYEKRWYYRLVEYKYKKTKSLMDDYDLNKIYNHLVICYHTNTKKINKFHPKNNTSTNDYDVRIYAFFDTYDEFLNYLYNFPDITERNFFEVIFGEFKQKPHFDIDIDIKNISKYIETSSSSDASSSSSYHLDLLANKILSILINTCIEILKTVNIELNIEEDILIYSSHSDTKRSFHLILNNICHDCNLEAKAFYDIIINHIKLNFNNTSSIVEFIDKNVYSSKQQFRTLGSQKLNSNRPKIFYEQFTINNINYNHIYKTKLNENTLNIKHNLSYIRLCESMITHTFDCKLLPSFMTNKIYTQSITQSISIDITFELANKCMDMLCDKFKSLKILCPFTFKNTTNNFILLQRINPSYCPLCFRIHENEHPFMYITYGKLFWDCRRYNQDKFFIGYVDIDIYNTSNNTNNNNTNNNNTNNSTSNNSTSNNNTSNIMIGDFDLGLSNTNVKSDDNDVKSDDNDVKSDDKLTIPKIENRLINIKSKIKRTSIEFFNKKYNSKD